MLYHILRLIVSIGIRLFYRQIRVKNREHLDEKGPRIIIANHPNTIMDAWILGYICNQRVYYMAKGTFFTSPSETLGSQWFGNDSCEPKSRRDQ